MEDKLYEVEVYKKDNNIINENKIYIVKTNKKLELKGEIADELLSHTRFNHIESITELTEKEYKENYKYYEKLHLIEL